MKTEAAPRKSTTPHHQPHRQSQQSRERPFFDKAGPGGLFSEDRSGAEHFFSCPTVPEKAAPIPLGNEEEEVATEMPLSLLVPTVMKNEGRTGIEQFEEEPIQIAPQAPNLDEEFDEQGLLAGELGSDMEPTVFVNGGKTGSATVHWAGGSGGMGNQGTGSITLVPPVIQTRPPAAAGGTAAAWVNTGSGTATVTRSYTGVVTGANGTYYITGRAAGRIDRHEGLHVTNSLGHHNFQITPLETRIALHTGASKAFNSGTTEAAAQTALETFLNWNTTIATFRTNDTNDNKPYGTVDTTDMASADFIRDYGARKVGSVNYAHYVDQPPGPPAGP